MNLGNALRTLGERESGTTRLEEAVAAHGAALEEATRARAPLQWAQTQTNLGTRPRTLGERESRVSPAGASGRRLPGSYPWRNAPALAYRSNGP